ncbi:VWA domain-containing protein [Segetibacter sp. 3557_3]|uniref:vWA domain-containing protein n=1 Tax=Segetibacter sp. 3557_3 TaxID=2547429 RepID=UPI0010589AE7|nr:VWA domain-containing protein [Segetibacter sp. 3557_3]TDH23341.1 VWA domain-containing protein [Segetibacter sp. 3557_3]
MLSSWLRDITFLYPWVLSLLLWIPIMVFWYYRNNTKRQASMLITTTHFITSVRSYRTWLIHTPFVLRMLALGFIIIALARPRHQFNEQSTEGEGIDIVLCFDISGSMTEKDFLPNRLEASKDVARTFVDNRTGDRIGIVIFSGKSFTLCPITTDKKAVQSQIDVIQSGYLEEDGTSIGSGLATSIDRLKDAKTKSKIIILLTDGVDFGGMIPPDIAMEMAKLYGIKIYAIGVGSEKTVDEQVETPFGRMNNKKKLEFNEGLLKNIALQTGGQYFQATDRAALERIYASINKLEKSKVKITTYNRYTEEYLPWVLIALGLLLLEFVLRYTIFKKFP